MNLREAAGALHHQMEEIRAPGKGAGAGSCPGPSRWRFSLVALSVGGCWAGWDTVTHRDVCLCLSPSVTVSTRVPFAFFISLFTFKGFNQVSSPYVLDHATPECPSKTPLSIISANRSQKTQFPRPGSGEGQGQGERMPSMLQDVNKSSRAAA